MNNILSFGGGVDSTALLAIHLNRDEAAALTGRTREEIDAALPMFDAVVFSDPGAEFPKTYENVETAAAICADAGLRFETVRKDGENIVEWLERLGNLPLLPGAGHVCSLKFKAEVLHKWAESQYAGTITWAIGIEANEGHRKFTSKETDTHQCIHPLVELGLDRADCERILRHLWPTTVEKSSCFFCPFQTKEELKDLHDNHPDLWAKCQEIEENFKVMSVIKHQRWLDAVAAGETDPNKRAPVGQWRKNSYAEGARLFAKSEKGSRKTVAAWGDEFANTENGDEHADTTTTNDPGVFGSTPRETQADRDPKAEDRVPQVEAVFEPGDDQARGPGTTYWLGLSPSRGGHDRPQMGHRAGLAGRAQVRACASQVQASRLGKDREMRLVQKYEIYRDEFLSPRVWCADAIDTEGNRWVKWQSGYRTRRTVEEACVGFEAAPIERVSDEGRHQPRRIERVLDKHEHKGGAQ